MEFRLTIRMGNEAMITAGDVADALANVAASIQQGATVPFDVDTPCMFQNIRDINGNIVGVWACKHEDRTGGHGFK